MIVILYGTYAARQAARLRNLLGASFEIIPVYESGISCEIRSILAGTEILVTNRYGRQDPPLLSLRLLQSPSAGLEGIDQEVLPPGCEVLTVHGHGIAIAEYVLCTMLDWSIGFRRLTTTFDHGEWNQEYWIKGPVHQEVYKKKVGVIGYGEVGKEIVRRASAFGMEVVVLSHWSSAKPPAEVTHSFSADEYKEFLADLDFVVVCVPLTPETHSLINASWFDAMKSTAVLINVSRGPVVSEKDLFHALSVRLIGGAVIDVWYEYPTPDMDSVPAAHYPFRALDNIVMTNHASARTEGVFARRWDEIANNIRRVANVKKDTPSHVL
jgi:phosphoglycerate dehydrogenase-like enzyme